MKTKLLAMLLLILVNETSSAQYSPMLTDNPKWIIYYSGMKGETGTYSITQGEDVVFGVHTYKKFIDPFFAKILTTKKFIRLSMVMKFSFLILAFN